ncbi:hypothetical protein GCM10025783_26930 [Amnibacterium soli]|uniref:Fis family transcriptional regulator n=1 Tax=Amnibacterium soli TaxID=1282736 RepID=A0ABP8ZDE5_9MICO
MRWDELFADLEGQLEHGLGAEEREAELEEERLRVGRTSLRDRIAAVAAAGEALRVRLLDGSALELVPRTVGRDWASGDLVGSAAQVVLPVSAVAALLPTAAQVARSLEPVALGAVTDRIGLAFVLRDLARRRRTVQLTVPGGALSGTIDRVGRDHLDLAVHPADGWRRASAVARIEVLALTQVLLVRVD